MFGAISSRIICHVVGYVYPAYMTCFAVQKDDFVAHTQWLTFWIVQTYFTLVEALADFFFSETIPFYYSFKVLLLLWLVLPRFMGAKRIYDYCIMPYLLQYERDIDEHVELLHTKSKAHIGELGARSFSHLRQSSSDVLKRGVAQLVAMGVEAEMKQQLGAVKEEVEILPENIDPRDNDLKKMK